MSLRRWLECSRCGRRWEAQVLRRSASSPGEFVPDYCMKCWGEGIPDDE